MVDYDGKAIYPQRLSDTVGYELSRGEDSEQALYERTTPTSTLLQPGPHLQPQRRTLRDERVSAAARQLHVGVAVFVAQAPAESRSADRRHPVRAS